MEEKADSIVNELSEMLTFVGLKKKKKVRFIKDEIFSSKKTTEVPNDENSQNSRNCSEEPSREFSDPDDLSFDLKKKKKKKKVSMEERPSPADDSADPTVECSQHPILQNDTDEDYLYGDLLRRIFAIMREKDPDRDQDSKRKLIMKPPQTIKIGTKKTSFVNFLEICKMLHRTPQHLQSFLLVELGSSGSIDGNNQLIVKGRFEQRQMETVLRRYIKEYVTCHTCRSPDTILQRDTRLCFLQCESCGSRCSVASVKSGYQALTGKRAAMRAKAST